MVLTYLWADVPKIGQKPPLPREDAPEAPVGRVAVPRVWKKVLQRKRYPLQGVFWRKVYRRKLLLDASDFRSRR